MTKDAHLISLKHTLAWKGRCRLRVELQKHAIRFLFVLAVISTYLSVDVAKGSERRQDAINGNVGCISYDGNDGVFSLVCSNWDLTSPSTNFDMDMDDYITLEKNEIFEGQDNEVTLSGNYGGMFRIASFGDDAPSSLDDAPIIRHVHMIGGTTKERQGFVVQKNQQHFIVDSCSTTGEIKGDESGGICGTECLGDILITNCLSSGDITALHAGGITGARIGFNGNNGNTKVKITRCHSKGEITSTGAGGICGSGAAKRGHLVITHSYSTGTINGWKSGGICGSNAGIQNGLVEIEQCHSEGEISADRSGGITGDSTGIGDGKVCITNSYSRGDITGGDNAGGVCGKFTAWNGGIIIIKNVYASGKIIGHNAGGIIGETASSASEVKVTMSVYNGDNGPIAGAGSLAEFKNSNDLDNITSRIYCYENDPTYCWNSTIWFAVPNNFPILQPPPTQTPSATLTVTNTPTTTGACSRWPSLTNTPRTSGTSSAARTGTPTPTNTVSETTALFVLVYV